MVVRAAGDALAAPPAEWEGELSYDNPWHGANIKIAEYNGLLAGIPDLATWDTTANATRGEAAEILAQLFYRTGEILTLVGPAGTQELTMAELKALAATEGYGGWKNKVGNITGPMQYKGVSLATLMALAGGGTKVIATACDGYKITYENGKLEGELLMYDPTTGETIFDPAVDTDIPAAGRCGDDDAHLRMRRRSPPFRRGPLAHRLPQRGREPGQPQRQLGQATGEDHGRVDTACYAPSAL